MQRSEIRDHHTRISLRFIRATFTTLTSQARNDSILLVQGKECLANTVARLAAKDGRVQAHGCAAWSVEVLAKHSFPVILVE